MPKECEVQMKQVISLKHLFVGARFKTTKAFIVCHPTKIEHEHKPTTTTEATTTTASTVAPLNINLDITRISTKRSTFIPSTTSNPNEITHHVSKCKLRMIA